MFLLNVIKNLNKSEIPYAIVGGFAMVLHGVVRGTVDLDFIMNLSAENFEKAEALLESMGLQSKLPLDAKMIFQFKDEYIKNRNLIAWSFYNPKIPHEVVDIILTEDLKKKKVTTINYAGIKIKVLAVDELIKMKKTSARPQDLMDVESLMGLKKIK